MFHFSENCSVYERMWETNYRARETTDDNIIRRMRLVCWITKATNTHTHSEYVHIAITRFCERDSMLRYSALILLFELNETAECSCLNPSLMLWVQFPTTAQNGGGVNLWYP
jgi:hypothetical protein